MKSQDRLDLFVIIGMVALSFVGGVLGVFDPLGGWALLAFAGAIFVAPTLYLLVRKRETVSRSVWAGLLFGVLFALPFDFVATYSNAWVINESFIKFPRVILGVIHLDEIIWFFFWALFVVAFYEHFVEHKRRWKLSRHVRYGVLFGVGTILAVLVLFYVSPDMLSIPYAYLVTGTLALAPMFVLIRRPRLARKVFIPVLFFAPVYCAFEIVALANGWWAFEGEYIGGIRLLGQFLPFEELVIWILLGSAAIATYYELFLDDGR